MVSLTLGKPITSAYSSMSHQASSRKRSTLASTAQNPEASDICSNTSSTSPLNCYKTKGKRQKKEASSLVHHNHPNPRTRSFEALIPPKDIAPHTLILGTHPSIASLQQEKYYGHEMNAFWWIAGDCLGFRRGSAVSTSSGKPYAFAHELRYGSEFILPYQEQVDRLLSHGFCLWDVVGSCHRPGSLDQDIQNEVPNDIRGVCQQYPSIRRIVLANGGTGSKFFIKHHQEWMATGELVCADNEPSRKAFEKALHKATKRSSHMQPTNSTTPDSHRTISLISAIAVSPAAARWTYAEKRDFWEQHVYQFFHEQLSPQHN